MNAARNLSPAIVIGSGGQVAGALLESLRRRGISVLRTSSSGRPDSFLLDLGNPSSIRDFFVHADSQLGPGRAEVFLPGALTNVDRCEEERELCRRVNEEGPALVAEECARRGHKLTFFSTEYVFGDAEYHGGAKGPFSETDSPAPSSFYGSCKLAAESRILKMLGPQNALLVRTTMVFSWNPHGNNFLMQYLKQLEELRSGRQPKPFRVPEDQISTPSYAPAVAEATCQLREQDVGGVINLVGADCLSRREVVERVIARFGFDREKSLEGFRFLKTSELGQRARRPLTAGLKCDKASGFGIKALSLDEALMLAKDQWQSTAP